MTSHKAMAVFPTNAQIKLAQAGFFVRQLDSDEVYADLFRAGCYFSAFVQALKSSIYYVREQVEAEGRIPTGKPGKAQWVAKCVRWQSQLGPDELALWDAVRLIRDTDVHHEPVEVNETKSGYWPQGFWPKGYWADGFWYERTTTRFTAPGGKTYCVRDATKSSLATANKFLTDCHLL
jgi:hypothetical protein